jgi:hypothetical protein
VRTILLHHLHQQFHNRQSSHPNLSELCRERTKSNLPVVNKKPSSSQHCLVLHLIDLCVNSDLGNDVASQSTPTVSPSPIVRSESRQTISLKNSIILARHKRKFKAHKPPAINQISPINFITTPCRLDITTAPDITVSRKCTYQNKYQYTWEDYQKDWKSYPQHIQEYCATICFHLQVSSRATDDRIYVPSLKISSLLCLPDVGDAQIANTPVARIRRGRMPHWVCFCVCCMHLLVRG